VAFTSLHCIRGLLRVAVWANASGTSDLDEVVGAWEGESICQVANSPCHDEHVIYEIAENNGAVGKVKIEGYKVVNSEKQWMGTLLCDYRSADHILTCAPKGGQAQRLDLPN
jgi:hypothetical protein